VGHYLWYERASLLAGSAAKIGTAGKFSSDAGFLAPESHCGLKQLDERRTPG